jgi:hypothetical protein
MNPSRISNINGKQLYTGIYAFTTTGATKDVAVPFPIVEAVFVLPLGTPASDEVLSVDETVTGTSGGADAAIRGTLTSGSTTLTVTRTGSSKTSGMKFSLIAIGR